MNHNDLDQLFDIIDEIDSRMPRIVVLLEKNQDVDKLIQSANNEGSQSDEYYALVYYCYNLMDRKLNYLECKNIADNWLSESGHTHSES